MRIIKTVAAMQAQRRGRARTACVPTMGNLHAGHLDLVRLAHEQADEVVVTLFVNRLQFLPSEDFDSYPRTFEADCAALERMGVHTLFAPTEAELYPVPQGFKVVPPAPLADDLEGTFRPGFFTGVATVVSKLFNIIAPDVALFGKKDYQQLMVIRQMIRQMALPIEIVAAETVRADDGLALSSRNGYLSVAERAQAPLLRQVLMAAGAAARSELRARHPDLARVEAHACQSLRDAGWVPDYVAVRKQSDLQSPSAEDDAVVVLGAARLGSTRLIDNLELSI
jgi:pantoate--beta-alanine ligase